MLIRCSRCGHDAPDDSVSCPNCGYDGAPEPRQWRAYRPVLLAALAAAVEIGVVLAFLRC
jgi:hypothetical protein